MKNILCKIFFIVFLTISSKESQAFKGPEFYEIRIYYFENKDQETLLDNYLQSALIPALHRLNIKKAGVFKPIANDTSAIKRIIVFIPFKQMKHFINLEEKLGKDQEYVARGKEYINTVYSSPPYKRIEKLLLKAFSNMPVSKKPVLKSSSVEKVYELRSYESATEQLYLNKVDMFNAGGEITLFEQLGFNAVFYGMVLAGSKIPNLMYMTSFENMDERNSHWKTFSASPEWKNLSSMPQYQKNVSKSEIILMRSTVYSDL
jgi:hypothetical protein